jgi:hypothetical protein
MTGELIALAAGSFAVAAIVCARVVHVVQRFAVESAEAVKPEEQKAEPLPMRPWHRRGSACSLCAQDSIVLSVRCKGSLLHWYCPVCKGLYSTPFQGVVK